MDSNEPKKKLVHKRTIVFVLLFVIIPWTLVAVPGESDDGGGTTGLNVNYRKHGWPFTHLHSTHYDQYGNWVNNVFIRGKPTNIDMKPLAILWHNQHFNDPERPPKWLEFDLRLSRSGTNYFEYGFWSTPENWPRWSDEHHSEVRWSGLIANLLFLFVVATIVAIPIERKVRNGTLFKYSLLSFGVAITLLGLVMAWGVRAYNGFHSEHQSIQNLARLENENLLYKVVERTDRFPRLTSQLLNNGQTWWGALPFFEKVENVLVDFSIDVEEAQLDRIVEATRGTDFKLWIRCSSYNNQAEKNLEKLDGLKIVSLNIDFDSFVYEWVEKKIGEEANELDWKTALEKAKLETNLDLRLPHLENLTLTLTNALPVKDQLGPFVGLPQLKRFTVRYIEEEGARFLLETHEHWPAASDFELTEDVSPELKSEFEKLFPGPSEEEGGVF